MKFIKILDPDTADRLCKSGFNYITENINGKPVYCFADDSSLRKYLAKNYSGKNFFESNKLCF